MKTTLPIFVLAALALALATSGCEKDGTAFLKELSSFRVEIVNGNPGSAETPMDFSATGSPFTLSIQAVDGNGVDMKDWSGPVRIVSVPGDVQPAKIDINGGTAVVDLEVAMAFGESRIWVEDRGTVDDAGTFATGVTETLWFRNPKVRDVQQSNTTTSSPFEGQRVTIEDGNMIVTDVTHEGVFVTDAADTEWNSIYMFTFNAPGGGLKIGDTLSRLAGTSMEFLGFTEFQNPAWIVSGTAPVPPATILDCDADVQAGGLKMERFESGLVEVAAADIQVCSSFPSCSDYDQYAQWTVQLPCGGRLNVVSQFGLPDFDPIANQGEVVDVLRGTLRHVQFASPPWILEPRDEDDLCCPSCTPALSGGC